MSDFKDFLAKVLAPVRSDSGIRPAQAIPEREAEPEPERESGSQRQNVPDEELERRYVEVMNELLADAQKHNAMNVFTDVVTWKLAVVAHQWGPRATGDVVRKLGGHLGTLAETADAQREADAAKEEGRRLN